MLRTPPSLRSILIVAGSMTTIGLMVLMAFSVNHVSSDLVTKAIGQRLTALADHTHNKIERTLFERSRDVELMAQQLNDHGSPDSPPINDQLAEALTKHSDFAVLTLKDSSGHRIAHVGAADAATESLLDVQLRESPRAHSTLQLFAIRRPNGGQNGGPVQFAFSTPVNGMGPNSGSRLIAVLGDRWAQTLLEELTADLPVRDATYVTILFDGNHPLAGLRRPPQDLIDLFTAAKRTTERWKGFDLETETGKIVATSRSASSGSISGEGLAVLVSQPSASALQPLTDLKKTISLYAIIFVFHAFVLHLVLSSAITSPLLRLAKAADRIRTADDTAIPSLTHFAEAKTLSDSLNRLVTELKFRQTSLEALKAGLETQVQSRTRALEDKNAKLALATSQAERAIEAKSRLLAVASHDLRQPLHALSLLSLALKRRVTESDASEIVTQVEQSVQSLMAMMDELLHVARLDAGLVERNLAPAFIPDLIDRLGAEFSYEADQRNLRFNYYSTPFHVLTDHALLELIIRNILSNAFKFTSSGGIVIAARSRGDKVYIEVYDTGPGIEDARMTRIFDEFERSPRQAKGSNAGLGLGLSIVERHARLIDADVTVRSNLGKGSRFTVILNKCHAPRVPHKAPMQQASSRLSMTDVSVMLVDDNQSILDALRMDLTDRGASVRAFASTDAAAEALRTGMHVDIAVVDYDLGDDDTGISFLRRQWQSERTFPALILTGRTDARTLSEITCSGISWMTKPAHPDALAQTIEQLSSRSSIRGHIESALI
jgi:signal transduction histidine kinase/ActR/RegA family two-component response regulator